MVYKSKGGNEQIENGTVGTELVFEPDRLLTISLRDGVPWVSTSQDYKYEYGTVYLTMLGKNDGVFYPYRVGYVKDGQLYIEDRGQQQIYRRIED